MLHRGPHKNNLSDTMGELHDQGSGWQRIYILQCQSSKRVQVTVDEYKLMLGTSLYNCTMSEIPEFAQPVAEPLELPDCFPTTEATGVIQLNC